MITLDESRSHFAAPLSRVATAPHDRNAVSPAATTVLHATLFLTILISPLVFLEPSPYEAACALLGLTCLAARVPFNRAVMPLAALLILWNVSGALPLMQVADDESALRYGAISIFMALTAIVYSGLFAQDTTRRLLIMRRAYILAALFAVILGLMGYFNSFPGANAWFAPSGRASGTFKDPNVFGPFLILPILLLIQTVLTGGTRPHSIVALFVLLLGLLLSFSRGAWIHFFVSAAIMVGLVFLTAQSHRLRARVIFLSIVAIAVLIGLFTIALSFDAIGEMFKERAKIIQSYDVGSGGRFSLQEIAIGTLLDNPLGIGPYEFARRFGLQQHNVYLQAFLVYGWVGGCAYVGMIGLTILVGLRAAFTTTPWQPYVIAALATFIGVVGEGFIIDTDHWRHYFLLLGLIWGLYAATIKSLHAPPEAAG